ncbi:MAG: MFS transporter, partial [Pseudomonadales bacterium]|nr:MFS transporter [Pseudomonadales bacterium]
MNQQEQIQAKLVPSKGYLNYVLFMLAVVAFFNYLDRMVLSMLLQPIKDELGFSDAQLGLLTGFAFAAFYATFGIPIARLADRKSRVTILSVCMALWSAMTAACGLAQNFIHMLLARMGVGVGEAGCVPTSHSLLSDYVPPEKRALALGIFQTGGAVGVMAGFIAAGWIADQWGWRMAFFLIGIPGVLIAVVAKMTLKDPPRGNYSTEPEPEPESFMTAAKALLGRKTFVHILIAY